MSGRCKGRISSGRSKSTIEQLLFKSVASRRFSTPLLGLFAAIALLLAAVGIYGVMSYTVAQRTREVGVRIALGSGRARVVRLVVRQGMLPAVVGLMLGTTLALAVSGLLRSQLFEIGPADLQTFLGVFVLIAAVSLLACYLPARRAARIDPVRCLRHE